MDDPYYRERAMIFMTKTILRYKDSPALVAWSLLNECIYRKDGCFCELTLKKFRDFLRERYDNDIKKLNAAWGTEFPVFYRSFADVEPGVRVSFSGGGYVPCIDYLDFNRKQLLTRLQDVKDLIEQLDEYRHPTTINLIVTSAYSMKYAKQHAYPSIFEQTTSRHPGFSDYNHLAMIENDNPT